VATCSSRDAIADDAHAYATWSYADASQSAPSAAGVPPPMTKWKKRGPLERVAAASARAISS
jgi:hypothetical protein